MVPKVSSSIRAYTEQIAELVAAKDAYMARHNKKVSKLQSLIDAVNQAKYVVGQALWCKRYGNVLIKDIGLDTSGKLMYKVVTSGGSVEPMKESDLTPVSLATEALFGNNK